MSEFFLNSYQSLTNDPSSMGTVRLINNLAKAGVVTVKQVPQASGRTLYILSPVAQEYVVSNMADRDIGNISFTLTQAKVDQITGIQQEGTDAMVDASIVPQRTAMYSRLTDALKDDLAECANRSPQASQWLCTAWPKDSQLNESRSRQFHFARYDDGWRVVN
jgi:hypothetical protein